MTGKKHVYDPWHKELVWIHTRRGFICVLFLNIVLFSLFNFHRSFKNIVFFDILKYEKANPNNNATAFVVGSQTTFENCTGERCKNATSDTSSTTSELYEILEFRARVYDFAVYSVFMTVSLWLLATVYRTSYEKTYFNALIHNCLLSYDLMENMKESKAAYLEDNPRPRQRTRQHVAKEEYGLHTFLREDLIFGLTPECDELKESLEDVMLRRQCPTPHGSNPYFLFVHVIEWIHDLLRAVKLMHKKNVYHLDLQPKTIYLHWVQSTVKTDYQAWLEDGSRRRWIKRVMKALVNLDKYEYAEKRHIVLAKLDHAVRSENGEVPSSAVGVPACYKPPECFNFAVVDAAKVDAWCIGTVAYELLTGGMLTVRASRYPPGTACQDIIQDTINKEFISTAMHTQHHLLHCFLDIRFIQKTFKNYDLDQTVFATDCWTFLAGLLKSSVEERFSVQQALKHPLMKRIRRQNGKVYYINYAL